MGIAVGTGASCMCTFGTLPGTLSVTSQMKVTDKGKPLATIMDNDLPNISPFGLCSAPSNPAVAAALGVPQPCVRVQAGPWVPTQSKVFFDNKVALTNDCMCTCAYGGAISISNPASDRVIG